MCVTAGARDIKRTQERATEREREKKRETEKERQRKIGRASCRERV